MENRLSFEEYEDPNQTFAVQQFDPLHQKVMHDFGNRQLRIINTNFMKCTKIEGLESIFDKINSVLGDSIKGSNQT